MEQPTSGPRDDGPDDTPVDRGARPGAADAGKGDRWIAVVAHPVKSNMTELRREVAEVTRRNGWREARWWETTAEETGAKQAREAFEAGASVVAVSGGDGTVRAVARALVGTSTPLAILPAGTGNLLARALGVSHTSREEAVRMIDEGRHRNVDVMEATLTRPDGSRASELSLVGLGIGLNADIMAGVDEDMKKRAGWLAYVVSGARALRRNAIRVRYAEDLDDVSVSLQRAGVQRAQVRSLLVVTCGVLVGGLRLLEESQPDDGVMETVIAAPRSHLGLVWQLGRLVSRRDARGPDVEVLRSTRNVVVECPRGTEAQVDGDVVGEVTRIEVTLRPGSLVALAP
ncbi:diacylglycerol/lipid kinase family protein [Aquipuribacter nitratireducens]|uniref:Diacylglycerol/lipid kinase family protein n=1 Tax=Aquipuribacter nitratireducens TaxID=650104 RepID=A0ABW0GN17_9MICO